MTVVIGLGLVALLVAGITSAALYGLPRLRRLWRAVIAGEEHSVRLAASAIVLEQMARGRPALLEPVGPLSAGQGEWSLIGGGGAGAWDGELFYKVRSLQAHKGAIFASVTGPQPDGPRGEVWRFAEGRWTLTGGGAAGAWGPDGFVDQLAVHDDALWAGAAGRLWRYADDEWQDAAGPLPVRGQAGIYAMTGFNGALAVSFWGDPGVALFERDTLRQLPPPEDWGRGVKTVYSLAVFQGQLYAGTGTGSLHGPGSSIFRYDGVRWEKVGGHGVRGSWTQPGIPFVLSLRPFGQHLIATLSRPHGTPAAASNVWAFDGHEWYPVAAGRTPDLMARSLIMNDALVYRDRLIVATGSSEHRNIAVWSLEAGQHWHDLSANAIVDAAHNKGPGTWIYSLCTDGVSLYAGTAGHRGAARVYRFTPRAST